VKTAISYILIIFTVISITAACFRPIGKCEYGEHPVTKIDVVVTSIRITGNSGKAMRPVFVEVQGKIGKRFYYSDEEYRELVKKVNLRVGSKGRLLVFSGGPCPPMYMLKFPEKN